MKIKTNTLTRPALDWAVAKCKGYFSVGDQTPPYWESPAGAQHFLAMHRAEGHGVHWAHSSTDWAEGGPIIEEAGITLQCFWPGDPFKKTWQACIGMIPVFNGPDPLVAAMRCYVASKLGDEIDIPDDLLVS